MSRGRADQAINYLIGFNGVGTIRTYNQTFTAASSSGTQHLGKIDTLPAGTWLIIVNWQIAAKNSGTRGLYICTGSDSGPYNEGCGLYACGSTNLRLPAVRLVTVAEGSTTDIYFNYYQDSGSSLNSDIKYRAVMIAPPAPV